MCILIIEDEVKIASYLVKGLNESGYEAQCVHSGLEGLEKLKMHAYSLVILDVMLPDIDGWAVLKVLRQFSKIPVIFLTAKDQVIDRVKGLELGADDYLAKPFSYIELLARIKSLLRRQQYVEENQLEIANLKLDLIHHKVWRNQQPVELSKKEFNLLRFLLRHPNEIITRRQIASEVWQINFDTDTALLHKPISKAYSTI